MPAEDGVRLGAVGTRAEDRVGAFGDDPDPRSGRPSQSWIARREASETVTIRSAQRTAAASLSRQAIRPLSRGKTSSGCESGSVSCIVTTSRPDVPDREEAVGGREVHQVEPAIGPRPVPWRSCRATAAAPGPTPPGWAPRPRRPRPARNPSGTSTVAADGRSTKTVKRCVRRPGAPAPRPAAGRTGRSPGDWTGNSVDPDSHDRPLGSDRVAGRGRGIQRRQSIMRRSSVPPARRSAGSRPSSRLVTASGDRGRVAARSRLAPSIAGGAGTAPIAGGRSVRVASGPWR